MLIEVNDDEATWRRELILCLVSPVSEQVMLERAQARPSSYAGRLVSSLHRTVFVSSLDLLHDFDRYFAKEYKTFGIYLEKRLLISSAVAQTIAGAAATARVLVKFSSDLALLQDEEGRNYLKTLVAPEACS